MTDTINDVAAETGAQDEPAVAAIDEQGVAEQLVAQAREKGIELLGPDGLLSQLTKRVLETALEVEMSDHLGYDKHDPVGPISVSSVPGHLDDPELLLKVQH
jgi:putative transposase